MIQYSFAVASDLSQIQELLGQCRLPAEDIASVLDNCITAKSGQRLVGVVAVETHGQSGLLRSLAVTPGQRQQGVGSRLCNRIISHARLLRIETLYLLTIDAEPFFATRGFERVAREAVPVEIQSSAQFHHICPRSAVCLSRDIRQDVVHATADLLRMRPDVPGARMWAVSLQQTMLTYFEVAPHSRFETHSHVSEQITMVLSGELYFGVNDSSRCVKPGEVIAIPSSVPHSVWTESQAVTAIDAWSPVMAKY